MKRNVSVLLFIISVAATPLVGFGGEVSANSKQLQEAATEYTKIMAKKGRPSFQFTLGVMYLKGNGIPKDYDKAFSWLKKSSNPGWLGAKMMLASLYARGLGTKPDLEEGQRLIMEAATKGHPPARLFMGRYWLDNGNLVKAYFWFFLAARAEVRPLRTRCGNWT